MSSDWNWVFWEFDGAVLLCNVQLTYSFLLCNQCCFGITDDYSRGLAGDHSQEFRNSRTTYFPQELKETKTD